MADMTDVKPATDADVDRCRNLYNYLARSVAARIDKEIKDRLAAEARVKVLTEVLHAVQWDVRGKCTACAGWNMSPSGETVKAHTADCPVAAALKEPANG